MEIGEYGYSKSELLQVAEQIYDLKGKKQQLELQLSSEEFHQKYIPRRENMVKARIMANLPLLLILSVLSMFSLIVWIQFFLNHDGGGSGGAEGIALLATGLILILSLKYLFKLIKEESEMTIRFYYSRNPDKAMRFAQKFDIKTFQDDRIRTDAKVDELKERILVYDNKIHNLEIRQQEILDEKKLQEEIIKKHSVLQEDVNNEEGKTSSLSLKKTDEYTTDIRELDEYYSKEQSYIIRIIKDLEFQLTAVEKDINSIDDEIAMVKKRIVIFIIAIIVASFIQGFIPGIIGSLYGLVCLIISLSAVFAIERYCRGPVIRYLVEKESELVAEYCFRNDVVPFKQKKKELKILIEQQEQALEEIKRKKAAL